MVHSDDNIEPCASYEIQDSNIRVQEILVHLDITQKNDMKFWYESSSFSDSDDDGSNDYHQNSRLAKLKLNEKKMFLCFRETMIWDPMDEILKKIESRKRKTLKNKENSYINSCSDSDDCVDNNSNGDAHSEEISIYSSEDDPVIRKKFKPNQPLESENEQQTMMIHRPFNKNDDDNDDESPPIEKAICRRPRRPTLRKDYLSSMARFGDVFNLIRYSCTLNTTQNFLKTPTGKQQVISAIRNCRNMATLIIPEEETAKASKVLLISQQTIKNSKSNHDKFRNSGWHRQLNHGVKMEAFLYQTNFRFLKKNLDKLDNWFIEEREDYKKPEPKMNFLNDHGYFNPDPVSLVEFCDARRKEREYQKAKLSTEINLMELKKNVIFKTDKEKDNITRKDWSNILPIAENAIVSTKIDLEIEIIHNWTEQHLTVKLAPKEPKPLKQIDIRTLRKSRIKELRAPFDIPNYDLENYIEWESKNKTNIGENYKNAILTSTNYFDTAKDYFHLQRILRKNGVNLDFVDLNDVEQLKLWWLTMRKKPKNFPYKNLMNHVEKKVHGRSQWSRLESITTNNLETHGFEAMIESFYDDLPYNPFEVFRKI